MNFQLIRFKLRQRIASALLAGALVVPCNIALAQQTDGIGSLKFAAEDADFYYGSYKLGEQWKRFAQGPVVREFMELPAVEKAIATFRTQWKDKTGFAAQARGVLDNGNAKEALAFFGDIASSDVFIVGDGNISKWYEAANNFRDEYGSTLPFTVDEDADDEEMEENRAALTAAFEAIRKLTIPTIVMGGKCTNEDLALTKIDQLETAVFAAGFSPVAAELLKSLKRVEDKRGNRLVWTYSGKQVPWDSIPTNESFDEEARDLLQEVVEAKSITLTIGLLDGYFVFGVSPTEKAVLDLAKGKNLVEHADMKPVKDAMSKELTSIGYVSDALSKANFDSSFKEFFSRNVADNVFLAISEVDEDSGLMDFADDIADDCEWLDESIAKFIPDFKGSTTVSFFVENGWEQHQYFRTKDVLSDSTQILSALDHVGGSPILFASSRLQYHPEYFQFVREIVGRLKGRFDEAVELDWSELKGDANEELDKAKKIVDIAWPFLVRLADTWEKKFLPSMNGEHTVVISAGNLAAKQWIKEMHPASEPLPLPEFATVTGLKDPNLFKSGWNDLFAICDDVVALIRQMSPEAIPPQYSIPRPVESKTSLGEKFGYPIPDDCPVPKEMMPQALFAGSYLVMSYSDKQSESLAKVSKLNVSNGFIDPKAKQCAVSYVHLGKIFDLARPWVRYALTENLSNLEDSLIDESASNGLEEYELTGKDIISAWKVFGKLGEMSSTSSTNPDGSTHVRSTYRAQVSQ